MGWVEKKHGNVLPSRMVSFYRSRDSLAVRTAFKPVIEQRLGVPIRHVVTYHEHTVDLGMCNTCSFLITRVSVWFKSSEGKLCKYDFDDSLFELMRLLNKQPSA